MPLPQRREIVPKCLFGLFLNCLLAVLALTLLVLG